MDGTLLNGEQRVSQANKEMILELQKRGIEFLVATGRAYNEVRFVFDQEGIKSPSICVNGSEIRDKEGKVLYSIGLDGKTSATVAQVLEEFNIYFELYTDKGTYSTKYEEGIQVIVDIYHTANPSMPVDEIKGFAEDRYQQRLIQLVESYDPIFAVEDCKVFKFLVFSLDDQLLLDVSERLKQLEGIEVTSSGRNNLEIMHQHAQKGIALKKYTDMKGISLEHTMALGDNYNDLSMLNIVGYSVAMGNAEQPIKEASKFETETNENDGVAKAIGELLNKM